MLFNLGMATGVQEGQLNSNPFNSAKNRPEAACFSCKGFL